MEPTKAQCVSTVTLAQTKTSRASLDANRDHCCQSISQNDAVNALVRVNGERAGPLQLEYHLRDVKRMVLGDDENDRFSAERQDGHSDQSTSDQGCERFLEDALQFGSTAG